MPAVVADGRGPIGRPDDVGEQQRRQHAIAAIGGRVRPGHEFLDVVDHLAGVLRSPTGVEVTRQLREPCSRDREGLISRDDSTRMNGSPMLWSTRVGAVIAPSADRTSKSASDIAFSPTMLGVQRIPLEPCQRVAGRSVAALDDQAVHYTGSPALLEVGPPCGSPMRGERGVRVRAVDDEVAHPVRKGRREIASPEARLPTPPPPLPGPARRRHRRRGCRPCGPQAFRRRKSGPTAQFPACRT